MIHFLIKFLVCFAKPVVPTKKGSIKKKPVKLQTPTKKEKVESVSGTEEVSLTKDENFIECSGNARNWCHIDYSIMEGYLPTFEINVVTWGEAAKIYTKDDCRAIKTIVIGDFVWVCFAIAHKILDLENADVLKFKASTIKFTFSQEQTKMMDKSTSDWPKEFTICKKQAEATKASNEPWFHELRQTIPLDEFHKEVIKDRADNFLSSRPEIQTAVSMLQLSPYEKKLDLKIKKTMFILQASENISVVHTKSKNDKNLKRRKSARNSQVHVESNKNKALKKSTVKNNCHLEMQCELFIAKKKDICVEYINVSPTLKYAAVLATASKILTDDQNTTFVPLSVTIDEIEALPHSFLQKLKLRNIFARYELANVLGAETLKVPIEGNNAILDDARVFFLSSLSEKIRFPQLMQRPSMLTLAEALMTRQLVVKLFGEPDGPESIHVEPCLFGQTSSDPFISKPGHDMFLSWRPPSTLSQEVFLGSASFNLVKLMKGFTTVEDSSVLSSKPLSSWDLAVDIDDVLDQIETEKEREAVLAYFSSRGCIPDSLLHECCTRIEITVSIGCPLSNLTEKQLLLMTNVCHRILIVFKDHNHATNLVQKIQRANSVFFEHSSKLSLFSYSSLSNFLTQGPANQFGISSLYRDHSKNSVSKTIRSTLSRSFANQSPNVEFHNVLPVTSKSITGFFIDHEEESILVIEAIPYITPYVEENLHALTSSGNRVVFDSSVFFTRRMYGELHPTNIFCVKMSNSMDSLLKNPKIYLKGTPDPALQALLLLDLLRRAPSMNSACVNQLFPSCDQLMSFSAVFGSTFQQEQRAFESIANNSTPAINLSGNLTNRAVIK